VLASTIIGGRDVIKEFVAADIWRISAGWQPASMIHHNVDWVTQQVPFSRFKLQLKEGQSLKNFIAEVEGKVDAMVGESTLNEYKAFKALVKHKRRVNRVFQSSVLRLHFIPALQALTRRFWPLLWLPAQPLRSKLQG
jgi:hypothetical protein